MDKQLTPLRRFFRLLANDRREIFYLYIYAIFHGVTYLSIPLGIQAVISLITTNQVSTSWIVLVILISLGVLLSGVLQMMQMAISEGIQQRIFTRAAFEFAYRIPRFKLDGLKGKYPPELINRFMDTVSIQKGLSKILIDFSTSSLQILFGLLVLSLYHPIFIMFGIILILLLYLLFRLLGPSGLRTSIKESSYKYEVVHWLEELARTMNTFKLAGRTSLPMDRTDKFTEQYLGARKKHFKILLYKYGGLVLFKVIVIASLLVIGGLLVINREMNIGQFVASEIIILMVMNAVEKVMLSVDTIYDVLTGIEKIGSVTDLPIEEDSGIEYKKKTEFEGMDIQLIDVTYRRDFGAGLPFINLSIPAGQKVFITGASGSSRSSLLNIVAALEGPSAGTILYDGYSGASLNSESLRSEIGDSLQDEHLFSGCLRDNVSLGRPNVSDEKIEEVFELTGLLPWFKTLPKGLDTRMLPAGYELPDHIVKRLILARGIAGNPRLLVIEDFLLNMPQKQKVELVSTIISKPWTLIAAGNDATFASMCDRVIVLERGQILADGTFQELMKDKNNRSYLFGA